MDIYISMEFLGKVAINYRMGCTSFAIRMSRPTNCQNFDR